MERSFEVIKWSLTRSCSGPWYGIAYAAQARRCHCAPAPRVMRLRAAAELHVSRS
jgi:hypothetical protein